MDTRRLRLPIVLACVIVSAGCGPVKNRHPVPRELADRVDPYGIKNVRTWGDSVSEEYKQSLISSILQEEAYYAAHPELTPPKHIDLLLISGGGENGAFGAGLLNGWTARGDRPTFRLVTGISTGALIAPFAFLGPEYDEQLRKVYTETSAKQILNPKSLLALLNDDSLADTEPLARLIDQEVHADLLSKIAAEHAKGRRLLIASVNLEAQRSVIWDMGAIASVGTPEAEKLFQMVMLASASIPGAFPPQYIPVVAPDGKRYDEMHVDGGTVTQVFLWGAGFSGEAARTALGRDPSERRPARIFVIRNGLFHPEYETMRPLFVDIAGRSVSTLIKYQGIGDMIRLYFQAQREGGQFRLAFIPSTFTEELAEPFDTKYMKALYEFGYDQAVNGYPWSDTPPLMESPHHATPAEGP